MNKTEFLHKLGEALQGEVSGAACQENIRYYDNYISQETGTGKSEEQVIDSIGDPRLIAKTIIESSEAAGGGSQRGGFYQETASENRKQPKPGRGSGLHYIDLSKWYWKILGIVIVVGFFLVVTTVLGGIFALLMRFAGPILVLYLLFWFIRNGRR